jgi:hypothetical protein
MLAGATCYFFDFTKNSEENQTFFINGSVEKGIPLDCWWIDAGWYPCDGDWQVRTRHSPFSARARGTTEEPDTQLSQGVKTG